MSRSHIKIKLTINNITPFPIIGRRIYVTSNIGLALNVSLVLCFPFSSCLELRKFVFIIVTCSFTLSYCLSPKPVLNYKITKRNGGESDVFRKVAFIRLPIAFIVTPR